MISSTKTKPFCINWDRSQVTLLCCCSHESFAPETVTTWPSLRSMSKSDFQSPECCSSCSDSVAETLSSCEGIFHDCWMAWLLLASGIRPQTPLTRIPYLLFPSACFIHSPCLSPQPASLHFCHLPPPGFVYFPSSFNQHHQSIRAQSVPFTVNGKRCWMRPVPCDEYSHSTIEILFVVLSSLRSLKHIAALQAPSSPPSVFVQHLSTHPSIVQKTKSNA